MPSMVFAGGPRSVAAGEMRSCLSKDGRDKARPSRKTPVHHPIREADNRTPMVFLTVCSQGRRRLFDKPDVHDVLKTSWFKAEGWLVGRYVVMPDHVHLFCAPGRLDFPPLVKWVQYWKSIASRSWPRPEEQPVWQRSFWDTQLRSGERYADKWEYVRYNPVRAGLCRLPEEWLFQGEMNVLSWHD
jgi:putative transposase